LKEVEEVVAEVNSDVDLSKGFTIEVFCSPLIVFPIIIGGG
jgi:hypothetical protein